MAKKSSRASGKPDAPHSFREYAARSVLSCGAIFHPFLQKLENLYSTCFPDDLLAYVTMLGGEKWGDKRVNLATRHGSKQFHAIAVRGLLLMASEARSKGHHREAEMFSFQAGIVYGKLPPTKQELLLEGSRKTKSKNDTERQRAAMAELQRRMKANPRSAKTSQIKAMAKEKIGGRCKWGGYVSLFNWSKNLPEVQR